MASKWRAFKRVVQRRQEFEPEQLETSNLNRCLTGWDLTALGLGSTLGVGVYVLVGTVALRVAGPSVVLSFLLAAVAAMFAGLCYAEFGARIPRAGSAYIYTYVTAGELLAFIVGWSNIFESMFGAASIARGLSVYFDAMVNHSMSQWLTTAAPINAVLLSSYFDIFAFLAVLVLGVLLAFGVRESTMVNNVLAIVSTTGVLFIVFAGASQANSANWSIPESEVPPGFGSGGFFPYGAMGMLRGAAICFYGFVGFDSISAAGEEARDPRRMLPMTIVLVISAVSVVYVGVATVVTMMLPYYLQDSTASVAAAFSFVDMEWASWIVSVGSIFGIFASLFGAMFALPRLLYAMSSDGLFFHWFARISVSKKSPVIATICPAVIISLLAGLLELEQLVMMLCIGTLLSYTSVAVCIIVLRYRSSDASDAELTSTTKKSYFIVITVLILYICACISSALVWRFAHSIIVPLSLVNVAALALMLAMTLLPRVGPDLPFKTPLVPIIPCLSIYFNVHLMIFINGQTWIRVLIWMAIGVPVYVICVCCYKRNKTSNLEENLKTFTHANKNGKTSVQIVVESSTPPDTMERPSNNGGDSTNGKVLIRAKSVEAKKVETNNEIMPYEAEEIVLQQTTVYENNEEKEAKIIDLLDQVLQAEEDSFGEIISLKENADSIETKHDIVIHRESVSRLSDAGSDASLGNDILSKYDVIAQVHREDLISEGREADLLDDDNEPMQYESVTAFNESDTNSRTSESGYSDTVDKTVLNSSVEEVKDAPYIPPPPPLDEEFFKNYTPPIPIFTKSYTGPKRPSKVKVMEQEDENKPRTSVQSNNSQGDSNLIFGSDKQKNFFSKLNNIFQSRVPATEDVEEQRRRSNSTGNVPESLSFPINSDRQNLFSELNKEIKSKPSQKLRPINKEVKSNPEIPTKDNDEENDGAMSKDALKSKLENIFSNGPFIKPRLRKSNPPSSEEPSQSDTSSLDSIPKTPKMEKNDTIGRQRAKYNEVMNSIRLSFTKDDFDKV